MIKNFAKGKKGKLAKSVWQSKSPGKLPFHSDLEDRALLLMLAMNATERLEDLLEAVHPPEPRLHALKGEMKGYFAIDIHKTSGWRITFRFEEGFYIDVGIENYH